MPLHLLTDPLNSQSHECTQELEDVTGDLLQFVSYDIPGGEAQQSPPLLKPVCNPFCPNAEP